MSATATATAVATLPAPGGPSPGSPPPAWLSVAEAAGTLRVSERVVLSAIHRGQLPARRIGKQYRLPTSAVVPPVGKE